MCWWYTSPNTYHRSKISTIKDSWVLNIGALYQSAIFIFQKKLSFKKYKWLIRTYKRTNVARKIRTLQSFWPGRKIKLVGWIMYYCLDDDDQWIDSPWPQRNNKCFSGLSRFVERCNDLLDLVETTRHFQTLQEAAQVGGAGTRALDALITDIHQVSMFVIVQIRLRLAGKKINQDIYYIRSTTQESTDRMQKWACNFY